MQPHVATVIRNTERGDQDGGRVVTESSRSSAPCFVQPGESQTIVDTTDHAGLNRVIEFNPTKIYFVDDPGLKTQDLIEWVDASGATHVYLVVGFYPPCGTSVMWNAVCQERV